jgi:hypothetical protein
MSKLDGKYEINPDTNCWEWTASLQGGYGRIRVGARLLMAHRYSYQLSNGEIPPGMLVCHKCDNPKCINPSHLFLGTAEDNAHDKVNKKRYKAPQKRLSWLQKTRDFLQTNPNATTREISALLGAGSPSTGKAYKDAVTK